MKKLFVLLSIMLYIFGSSYLVHADTMVLPYMNMQDSMDSGDCSHQIQSENQENSKDNCLDRCLWSYDELSSWVSISLKNLKYIETWYKHLLLSSYTNIKDIDKIAYSIKDKIPPDNIFPYPWFIGKITILLI